MKYLLTLLVMLLSTASNAQDHFVNITPRPMHMEIGEDSIVFPNQFNVAVGTLPRSMFEEGAKLLKSMNIATKGWGRISTRKKGLITMHYDETMPNEAYHLSVNRRGITLTAGSAAGFFYAGQTLKKMMPANVMAEKPHSEGVKYYLPCMEIEDAPRFWYRGFMLDCARHFFPVEDIKHILDGMAAYKLNYFHWHLTDDQGWRFEVKKYPRLTEVGSIASDCRLNDMEQGVRWQGKPYGPYYYTQEQCREIVEYASKLHIQVVPEIDMPGHFMAAMAAYPEFSCWPNGEHKVQTHQGGIWSDVLNVGNPKAVQFAKDILTEVMDVFPCEYIHIGGDECPVSAWEKNEDCQQLLQQLLADGTISPKTQGEKATTEHFSFNMQAEAEAEAKGHVEKNFRPLQSYFTRVIGEHLRKNGKKMFLWNESITAKGSDLEIIKETGATIFCWAPCQKAARMASEMGLDCVITEWAQQGGCYYINRKQWDSPDEPAAAGYASKGDQLPGVYDYVPVPEDISAEQKKHYVGVQATFWTEWVSEINYLNYLAFPRLLAVAEAAWTPQALKDWDNFLLRCKADVPFFEITGRRYGNHYLK